MIDVDLDEPTVGADGLRMSAAVKAEAWAMAIEQCRDLAAVQALEERLHRRLELLRKREVGPEVEREALSLCAARASEIAAASAAVENRRARRVVVASWH